MKLKRPQWVISNEEWEFKGKDRFCMEYVENGNRFTLEVDDSPVIIGVYIDTIKLIEGNLILTTEHKELIKKGLR